MGQGVQARAVRGVLLALRWGQDLDAVRGGELGDADRVGRGGLGQPQVASRLARGRHELVESARGHHDDDPAWAGAGDGEAVRDAVRQVHQRARPGLPRLLAAEPVQFAVYDQERLIARLVDMRRRREGLSR